MWILDWLPSSWELMIINLIIASGFLCYVASKIVRWVRLISTWALPLELIGICALVLGAFLYSGFDAKQEHTRQVAVFTEQVRIAEETSQKVNIIVQDRVVTKINTVKEIVYVNKEVVKETSAKLDADCKLPVSTIVQHNAASQNKVASGPGSVDGTTSDVKASALLSGVVENYGTCYELREQVIGWQQWYEQQRQIFESIK